MLSFEIQNFKFGLDSRRSELTSQPGTLETLQDAHINQGGEIEKRKEFVDLGVVPTATGIPVGSGFEVVSGGPVIFGSAPLPAGLPTNVLYQQLVHPAVTLGAAYNPAQHAMTAVLASTSFGGSAWVAAQYADSAIFAFYNGTAIPAFYNGIVLSGYTTAQNVAAQLALYIATLSGLHVGPVTANGANYFFDMYSDAGLAYTLTMALGTGNAGTGNITATNISTFTAGVTGSSATTLFTITGGSNANAGGITGIQVYDQVSATWKEILGVHVLFSVTNTFATFADNVAAQIATYSSGLNVTATATNATVNLTFDIALGTAPNGDSLRIQTTGDCCVDNTVASFAQNTTPSGLQVSSVKLPNQTNLIAAGTVYSSGGSYTLTGLTVGVRYFWQPNANDTSLAMSGLSGSPLTTAQSFVATATSATLNGTASTTVTAYVLTYVEILGSTITSGTVLNSWIAAIASAIRAYCKANLLNYTAYANGSALVLSRSAVDTSLPFGSLAVLTTSGAIVTDGSGVTTTPSSSSITAIIIPNPILSTVKYSGLNAPITTPQVACAVIGGLPPYSWAWSFVSGNSLIIVNTPASAANADAVTFTLSQNTANSLSAVYKCTVTDSVGVTGSTNVSIIFI